MIIIYIKINGIFFIASKNIFSEICFKDKLTLFIEILELCITESGDKAKCLNKLHDCLLKTRVCYDHYSSKLGEEEDDRKCYYDFYVCIMDDV